MSEENKNMFVMHRDFNVSGFGYGVSFLKDVPTFVPPLLHTEAMRCGATALDDGSVSHVQAVKGRQPEVQGESRVDQITRAMNAMVEKNSRMDFGADGLPTTRAIFRMTGIDIELNERNSIWQKRVADLTAKEDPSNLTITEEEKAEIAAGQAAEEKQDVKEEAEASVAVGDELGAAEEVVEAEIEATAEKEAAEEKAPAPTPKKKAARRKK